MSKNSKILSAFLISMSLLASCQSNGEVAKTTAETTSETTTETSTETTTEAKTETTTQTTSESTAETTTETTSESTAETTVKTTTEAKTETTTQTTEITAEKTGGNSDMIINIDLTSAKTEISPYIYGINDFENDCVSATALRQGGNRYTGYNWENNFSNAGSDWQHYSDSYLVRNLSDELKNTAGACAINLSDKAKKLGGAYTITTIPMAGKVSADGDGAVTDDSADRWKIVKSTKGSEFSLTPDTSDDYVYVDEYINYLVETLGDSTSENGINGYNLDNEPSLWSGTHPYIHKEKAGIDEIVELGIEYASAIKSVDPNAEIFGPALFGVGAYNKFNNDEWNSYKSKYPNFISYYLDEMNKAEASQGKRLLDVIDLHYYSEARGDCRVTECKDISHTACNEARMQAPRSLFKEGYYESSWIGDWVKNMLPIIPTVREAIDKYYPGTKISFSEYNFGGPNHISGTIAEVDALGAFAENEVYTAMLWPLGDDFPYIASGINLYTNYDGKGSSFGDNLVKSESSDEKIVSTYASINGNSEDKVTLALTNKSDKPELTTISVNSQDENYSKATIYGVVDGNSDIVKLKTISGIKNNSFDYEIPAYSALQIVIE